MRQLWLGIRVGPDGVDVGMSKQSRAEDPSPLADEERLKKALGEIERVRAELRLEQTVADIDRIAADLRKAAREVG
jgi:hypothetical protein